MKQPSNSRIPTSDPDADAAKALPLRKPSQNPVDFTVRQEVNAISIPDGGIVSLKSGLQGKITQALGSSYTVVVNGRLFRIDGELGEHIGQPKLGLLTDELAQKVLNEDSIKEVLK